MSVHVVADTIGKLSALRSMLEGQHAVTSELLNGGAIQPGGYDAVVVTADLRPLENIAALREVFGKLGQVRKRIVLIDQRARLLVAQAYALGATRVLVSPVSQASLLGALADSSHSEAASMQPLQ